MKTTNLLVIFFSITLSVHDINGNADFDILSEPKFFDKDFIDYNEDPDLINELSEKTLALQDLETEFNRHHGHHTHTKTSMRKESIKEHRLSNKLPKALPKASGGTVNKKSNSLQRPKREAGFSLTSLEDEDLETVYKRIEKLNPEKAKLLNRKKRDLKAETPTFREETDEPLFNDDESRPLNEIELNCTDPALLSLKNYLRENQLLSLRKRILNNKPVVQIKNNKYLPNDKEREQRIASFKQIYDFKAKEILKFLERNFYSTNYIHGEVMRIKKQGKVGDKFRLLIQYLESPGHEKLKEYVLNCYYARRKIDKPRVNIWADKYTNNLLIDPLKDPYNHDV